MTKSFMTKRPQKSETTVKHRITTELYPFFSHGQVYCVTVPLPYRYRPQKTPLPRKFTLKIYLRANTPSYAILCVIARKF